MHALWGSPISGHRMRKMKRRSGLTGNKFGELRNIFGRVRPSLVDTKPTLVDAGRTARIRTPVGTHRANSGPSSTMFDVVRANFGCLPGCDQRGMSLAVGLDSGKRWTASPGNVRARFLPER